MYLSVVNVKPLENYQLWLKFENEEEKIFSMKPYLELGRFQELKDERLFKTVRICFDSIEWENHLDLDPEILYQESEDKPGISSPFMMAGVNASQKIMGDKK